MRAAVAARPATAPPRPATPPFWVGDPSVLVFAVRYALSLRGGHVPEFVHQAVEVNARQLPPAARLAIVRDIRAWLSYGAGVEARPEQRAVWVAVLAALGVDA